MQALWPAISATPPTRPAGEAEGAARASRAHGHARAIRYIELVAGGRERPADVLNDSLPGLWTHLFVPLVCFRTSPPSWSPTDRRRGTQPDRSDGRRKLALGRALDSGRTAQARLSDLQLDAAPSSASPPARPSAALGTDLVQFLRAHARAVLACGFHGEAATGEPGRSGRPGAGGEALQQLRRAGPGA